MSKKKQKPVKERSKSMKVKKLDRKKQSNPWRRLEKELF